MTLDAHINNTVRGERESEIAIVLSVVQRRNSAEKVYVCVFVR
jgi:hypothetical protein